MLDKLLSIMYTIIKMQNKTENKITGREKKRMNKTIESIEVNGNTIIKGTRIYYTGDVANIEDFGHVSKLYSDRWGTWMTIRLDDGRTFQGISSNNFAGPGRRFMTEKEYEAVRKERIEKLIAATKK